MTTESVMVGRKQAGWWLAEWATDRGHVAEAERGGHHVIVTAGLAGSVAAGHFGPRVTPPTPSTGHPP
jgi:hypothetical protein